MSGTVFIAALRTWNWLYLQISVHSEPISANPPISPFSRDPVALVSQAIVWFHCSLQQSWPQPASDPEDEVQSVFDISICNHQRPPAAPPRIPSL